MKNNIKNIVLVYISITVLSFMLFFITGCKEPMNPKAKVYVIDEHNKPVDDAMVVVRAPVRDTAHTIIYRPDEDKPIADTGYTNRNGEVYFEFKYEAIYRVEVTKTERNRPTRRGIGVLILEKSKTVESRVTINEQTVFN